jgi:hypothetical protein
MSDILMPSKTKYKNTKQNDSNQITLKGITNIGGKVNHNKETFATSLMNYNTIRDELENGFQAKSKPADGKSTGKFKIV